MRVGRTGEDDGSWFRTVRMVMLPSLWEKKKSVWWW